MVPCQPRQLVIYSLPLAALVAFLWFKRRKSSSRSDPGGTLALTKPVDITAKSSAPEDTFEPDISIPNGKALGDKKVDECSAKIIEADSKTLAIVEACIVTKVEHIVSASSAFDKIVEEPVACVETVKCIETTPTVEEESITCNGAAVPIKEEPEVVSVVHTEVENKPRTPDFDISGVFHSTIIEDKKDLEDTKSNTSIQNDKPDIELVQNSEEGESLENLNIDHNCADKENTHNQTETENQSEEQTRSIPFEEQSTLENGALNNGLIDEQSSVEDSAVQSDLNTKSIVSDRESVDKEENISTDTGLGSQDQSASEDSNSNMAQGPKTEEKTQSNASGLEQKLASLGLEMQPPAQRDSANHSPAEVMLNSPAISTYSDAHSEGSSDSGKGCSDVVTPPSCTPAGGSSVAGDQAPSVYEFVLPQVIVGRLIGRHGIFLHDIRAKTHTNVFIKRHPETNSLKICAIEGTQPDIDAAIKMIRQKFPLRRFPDLTLEKVTFVKNSGLPISPENLQLHLVEGVNNDVLLSSLITAGHFFLQLPMHMSYQSLYRLACIMNSVYNTQESPPLPDPQPDVVCVAPATGGWYRVQILTVDEEAHTSDVKFLDYGGFLTVSNSSLRQIRGDFLLLPFQAVECVLANVIPSGGEEEWSEEAKQFVQLMTTHQTLQAQVYDYTDTGLPLIYLYCTQFYQSATDPTGLETRVVLLNQELVSNGFAELIDASQEDEQTTATESS